MQVLKDGFRLAYFFTSAIIGAGFISGREVANHFAAFDNMGFFGIVAASGIMGIFAAVLMIFVNKYRHCSFSEFTEKIYGKKISFFIKLSTSAFMLIILSAMVSGASEILTEIFPLNAFTTKILFLSVCFLCIIKNSRVICSISSLLCPAMVLGIILVCTSTVTELPHLFKPLPSNTKNGMWFFSALCWCAYNIVTLPSVVFGIKGSIKTKKAALIGGIISFLLILVCSLFIYFPETLFYSHILDKPLPLAYLCTYMSKSIQYIYLIIFLCAVFTTATSILNALCTQIQDHFRISRAVIALIIESTAFIVSLFGFYRIVGNFYEVFAFVGFFMFTEIIMKISKNNI